MGIPGIYNEIGPGERVSLAKLAIDKFEQTGRPLRIAVDISIWNFEIQGGKGGPNPALRTLFYRLVRLAGTSVQAVFVFDGPKRPLLKRNKVRRQGSFAHLADVRRTKLLLQLLGFESHDAPGEAEAECALLQQQGLVDAVLSEDVDTLMFGSRVTIRDWSCEGSKKSNPPTHVSLYDANATKNGKSGLDREGMILVALMSGGDYDTAGITGCGVKIACEAARAGFGKSLCDLSPDDASGLLAWRENLTHELRTNESSHFRQKNKSIIVPDDFPRKDILHYYTHPVVSSEADLLNLRSRLQWDREIDSRRLRAFVDEVFEWSGRLGAKRLIRLLAPPMLIYKLRERPKSIDSGHGNLVLIEAQERDIVCEVGGERQHFTTDGTLELRLTYRPSTIVGLDVEDEVDNESDIEQQYGDLAMDEENFDGYQSDIEKNGKSRSMSPVKNGLVAYDPTEPTKTWVFRSITRIGVPLLVEDYEESLMLKQSRANPAKRKNAANVATKKHGGMKQGALDRYFVASKPLATKETTSCSDSPSKKSINQPQLPPVYLAPSLGSPPLQQKPLAADALRPRREYRKAYPSGDRYSQISPKPVNPWTPTQSSKATSAKVSKSGVYQPRKDFPSQPSQGSSSRAYQSYLSDEDDMLPPLGTLLSPSQNTKDVSSSGQTPRQVERFQTEGIQGSHNTIDLLSSSPLSHHATPTQLEQNVAKGRPFFDAKQGVPTENKPSQKRFIAPRESLPGAWKKYTEEEIEDLERNGRGRRRWRVSQVEALDLTQD